MQASGDSQVSSRDMAAYMRWWRRRHTPLGQLRQMLRERPVASHRPLPDVDDGHCLFCGDRTIATDQVCSRCRREIES